MTRTCVALLGRRDQPTDAVEEYCRYLAMALGAEGCPLAIERVAWLEKGWRRIRSEIRSDPQKWKGRSVLLQYTALGWSRRALPFALLRFVHELKRAGAHCAVVFHDAQPYPGPALVARIKRKAQALAMRRLSSLADLTILTVPLEQIGWLPGRGRFAFVPVGANLPHPEEAWAAPAARAQGAVPTLAMFSPTGGAAGTFEARVAAETLNRAAETLGAIRLVVLGRNSEAVGARIRDTLGGRKDIAIEVAGLLGPEAVVSQLARTDAMLFVRGSLSTRRGSGIAGIACGLPLIALEGAETAGPIRDAGVLWVSGPDPQALAAAVVRLFHEPGLRETLAAQSREAYRQHFSWAAIARRMVAELDRIPGG